MKKKRKLVRIGFVPKRTDDYIQAFFWDWLRPTESDVAEKIELSLLDFKFKIVPVFVEE